MVYAYMDNIYSSRKIEKTMRVNINFMWLSAQQVADHNTIYRFIYIKYNTFDKEQGLAKKKKNKDFHRDTLYYDKENDRYICPFGQSMEKIKDSKRKTKSGYVQHISKSKPL